MNQNSAKLVSGIGVSTTTFAPPATIRRGIACVFMVLVAAFGHSAAAANNGTRIEQKTVTRDSTPGAAAQAGGSGFISEDSATPANFRIHLTDRSGREIFKAGFPRFVTGHPSPDGHWRARILVPGYIKWTDAWNDIIPIRSRSFGTFETEVTDIPSSVVMLEALYRDQNGAWGIEQLFDCVNAYVGSNTEIFVPDLAFSDSQGNLIADTTLYSLVDLNTFLPAGSNFDFGDVLQIEDGFTPSLQGMLFSSTPFSFDPETGFTGTPIDGYGTMVAYHGLRSAPVPESSCIGGIAGVVLSCLVAVRMRRSRQMRQESGVKVPALE